MVLVCGTRVSPSNGPYKSSPEWHLNQSIRFRKTHRCAQRQTDRGTCDICSNRLHACDACDAARKAKYHCSLQIVLLEKQQASDFGDAGWVGFEAGVGPTCSPRRTGYATVLMSTGSGSCVYSGISYCVESCYARPYTQPNDEITYNTSLNLPCRASGPQLCL